MDSNMEDRQFEKNIKRLQAMRNNPCAPNEHEYQDYMFTTESMGTMLHVICSKCLDMQGWIFHK